MVSKVQVWGSTHAYNMLEQTLASSLPWEDAISGCVMKATTTYTWYAIVTIWLLCINTLTMCLTQSEERDSPSRRYHIRNISLADTLSALRSLIPITRFLRQDPRLTSSVRWKTSRITLHMIHIRNIILCLLIESLIWTSLISVMMTIRLSTGNVSLGCNGT